MDLYLSTNDFKNVNIKQIIFRINKLKKSFVGPKVKHIKRSKRFTLLDSSRRIHRYDGMKMYRLNSEIKDYTPRTNCRHVPMRIRTKRYGNHRSSHTHTHTHPLNDHLLCTH